MDAQVRRRRTQDAVKRILLRESLNQPLMLIFEDLHWIDEETQAFLNLLVEGIANVPALLLVNYRPEYTHQWGSKTYYTQLRLDPLGKESAAEMLSTLLGDGAELAPLRRIIIKKTEGNPLFMEEIFQALIEDGSLQRNGRVKLVRPVEQLRLPPTVQGILAARIDRLRPEEKELLQTLAVIGTEFPLSLVRQVVQLQPDQLDGLLVGLQTAEFIYEQPAAGDVEYSFKHALTRQVADESLLSERRKLLHERTAGAIEALYRESLKDHYAELARHYRQSDNAKKAVEYLRLSGEQALDRGAYAQALANVEPALKLIERLPDETERLRAELGVRLFEGRAVTVLYGIGSAERVRAFERLCELGERLRDDSAQLRGLINMGFAYANRGEAQRGQEIARRGLALIGQNHNREIVPHAQLLAAWCAYGFGNLLEASSRLSDLMKRLFSARQGDVAGFVIEPWAIVPMMRAQVRLALGRSDEALKLVDEALRRARQLKHPFMLASALTGASTVRYQRREPEAARETADASIALAEQYGFSEFLGRARAVRGWALSQLGQTEQGLAELKAGSGVPNLYFFPVEMMFQQAHIRMGRSEEMFGGLREALARVERSGAHVAEPELYRLKGEAILMRDLSATRAAEECFSKAIGIAKGQSAKWWELRSTVSLARLLRDINRRDEARAMLAEIYNWFTEGFDTADLKDAKALLDELCP
jgi:tetratricopeptide (TPR) repeat protein